MHAACIYIYSFFSLAVSEADDSLCEASREAPLGEDVTQPLLATLLLYGGTLLCVLSSQV